MDDPRSLPRRTVRAAKWRLALVATNVPVQFGVGVVLARLLPPEDFGLLALAMIVIGLVDIVVRESLNPAVVQRRPLTERHIRVAFTLSVLMGACLSGLVMLLAPLSATLFDAPNVSPVLQAVGLIFFVNGFGNIGSALLWRRLDFRRVFQVVITSYLLGYALVSIVMAVMGFGVWSLVMGTVARHLVEASLVLLVVRHPRRPLLSGRELRELGTLGVGFSLRAVADFLARQGDHFVVGRWLGSHALGLYSRAFGLMRMPADHLRTVVHNVLFPALSEAQGDRGRLTRGYLVSVQLTAILVAPVMVGLVVAAPHLIGGIYGENWLGAVGPLQVLCIGGLFQALFPVDRIVAEAMGEVYRVVPRVFFYALLVVAVGVLVADMGVVAVAGAVSGAALVMYLSMIHLTHRLLGIQGKDVVSALKGGVWLAVAVAGASVVTRLGMERWTADSLFILGVILLACAVSYLLGLRSLPVAIRPCALFELLCSDDVLLPPRIRRILAWILRIEGGERTTSTPRDRETPP